MDVMGLILRADASPEIGAGHVMRIYAIAEEAISRGIDCTFVGNIQGIPWLSQLVYEVGFSKILASVELCKNVNEESILVLDSYTLDVGDFSLQKSRWKKVIVIADDVTPNYDATLTIHPGMTSGWFKGNLDAFLSGPEYVLTRKAIKKSEFSSSSKIEQVLVFAGGTDSTGITLQIANKLSSVSNFGHAVIYADADDPIARLDSRFLVKPFGSSLDFDIDSSQVVLTTASTSGLEIIARGIPLGVICVVENQLSYYKKLGELGVSAQLGILDDDGVLNLCETELQRLFSDFVYRKSLIAAGRNLIDLGGPRRVVNAIVY